MTVQSELITFSVIAGFAGVSMFVALALSVIFALWQRRSSPAHLWVFQCAIITIVCLLNVVDWQQGFIQRTKDGREVPWFRSVATVLLYTTQGSLLAGGAHVSVGAGSIITLLGAAAGGSLAGADMISWPYSMWPLAAALALLMVQVYVVVRKSQTAYFGAIFTAISSFSVQFAFLLVQFLSWAMLQGLDKNPHREVSEICFTIVYGAWIICSGLSSYLYTQYPADMEKRKPY